MKKDLVSVSEGLGFRLNIDLSQVEESERASNQPSLEMFDRLIKNGYYFMMQPKTNSKGEAYLWIIATKKGEDRESFSLYVNDQILNYVITSLTERECAISGINADGLKEFNKKVKNFEFELYLAEKAQGKTMSNTHTTTGQTVSSHYKRGVIIFKPYRNPELKAHLNA